MWLMRMRSAMYLRRRWQVRACAGCDGGWHLPIEEPSPFGNGLPPRPPGHQPQLPYYGSA
jgi:hypothetical protein